MATGTEGPDILANDPNLKNERIDALGGDDTINVSMPNGSSSNLTVDGGADFDTLTITVPYLLRLSPSDAVMGQGPSSAPHFIDFSSVERLVIHASAYTDIVPFQIRHPSIWTTGDTQDEIHVLGSYSGTVVQVSTGGGDDQIYFGSVANGSTASGGAGNDLIDLSGFTGLFASGYGGDGDDTLIGGSGTTLYGGAGSDELRAAPSGSYLHGGEGDDTLIGGPGGDEFEVDSPGDIIVEAADGDWDEVRTMLATYSLVGLPNVEQLRAISGVAHDFRGNAAANEISGREGNDLLRLNDGGDDLARGGAGDDVLYFGAAMTAADKAQGDQGSDVVVLQGDYALTLGAATLAGIEALSLQSGANARWGDTSNAFYDYDIATVDANVAPGSQLIVNGQSLRIGEDFAFDGSAETDGKFLVFGGHGVDTLTGGAGNDVFVFEGGRWDSGDSVDGGGGRDSLIISLGDGLHRIEFGEDSLANVEAISVNDRYARDPTQKPSYELVLTDGNVEPGAMLTLNGSSLSDPSQFAHFDGSAVLRGDLTMFGGVAHDTLRGGAGADVFHGGLGADALTGGGGADSFRYDAVGESAAGLPDVIGDFAVGVDKVDLSRIDADTHQAGHQAFRWIGADAFTGSGAASAGELRLVSSNGFQWVEGDVDGDGAADLVIGFQIGAAPLSASDFLL